MDSLTGVQDPEARLLIEEIRTAASPEEAARLGRSAQRTRPHLVTPNWDTDKLFVMYAGLKAKVSNLFLQWRVPEHRCVFVLQVSLGFKRAWTTSGSGLQK